MTNGTNFTAEQIIKWNREQLEIRQDLPTLFELLERVQNGEDDLMELLFFYRMDLKKHKHDGKMVTYSEVTLELMDKRLNHYLKYLKEKYSDNRGINNIDRVSGHRFKVVTSSEKFETEEIESMFYDYLIQFVHTKDLSKFKGESLEHSNNLLMKYIRIDFENNVLKTEYNKRQNVDRITIEGEQFLVKHQQEEVYFDDIITGIKTEDGENVTILDIIGAEQFEGNRSKYAYNREGQYIVDNYKNVLTANQQEKFQKILDWCEQDGNTVNDLFHKNNPSEFNKSALSKILYPDRKPSSTTKDIDTFLQSMNSRMRKALAKAGIEDTRVAVRSDYRPLKHASEEDNYLFCKYNIDKHVIGYNNSNFPDIPMYKGNHIETPTKYISFEDYEALLNGQMTIQEIISKYKITQRNHKGDLLSYTDKNIEVSTISNDTKETQVVQVPITKPKGMLTPIELYRFRADIKKSKQKREG